MLTNVSKNLRGLRFYLQIGTMHIEQGMYSKQRDVSETIPIQNTYNEDETMWILGLTSINAIGLSKLQTQTSTIILTKKSGTFTIKMPRIPVT